MQCILSQNQTTPEKLLSNPWYGKSFFEPEQYKSALDRCEGGFKSCELHIDIFKDLVQMNEDYAKAMHQWSISSQKQIHQSKDFGTNKKAWLDIVRAIELTANKPDDLARSIQHDVVDKMVAYKNENYGRSFVHRKKSKEFDREFRRVQKSWVDLLEKINETKQTYQELKHKLKTAEKAARMIQSDAGSTDEQKKLVKASVEKRTKDVDTSKDKYQRSLDDMDAAKPKYEADMTEILNRTHEFECKRLQQYNQSFTALQGIIAIAEDPHYTEISEAFAKAIASHSSDTDIRQWNENYGSEAKIAWPLLGETKE